MALIDQSCRVAFAAMLHDLGKFAQRANAEFPDLDKDAHLGLYARFNYESGYFSHLHAAYTALAYDTVGRYCPDAYKETSVEPFMAGSDLRQSLETDTMVNAAAMHHRPTTLLQWIIATADRVSSGFEREQFDLAEGMPRDNFLKKRLLTLFEQVSLSEDESKIYAENDLKYRYPLLPASIQSIFPSVRGEIEPISKAVAVSQYKALWDAFVKFGDSIPNRLRNNWSLWLDSFDSAWFTYTQSIPSATYGNVKSDVSLYDHSKSTAALATALWRWQVECCTDSKKALDLISSRSDWDIEKFLIIQGDFFGIQNFIFSEGSQTNRQAAKILRGRSFYVSLLIELAALRILEELELPPTSQITNAAGKFMIVAPNTPNTIEKLKTLRSEFNRWFVEHMYGTGGLGLVWTPISSRDLSARKFKETLDRLFKDELSVAKLQRFSLTEQQAAIVLDADYSKGVCEWHGKWPADKLDAEGHPSCAISRDEIRIGQAIVKQTMLAIVKDKGHSISHDCEQSIFGYRYCFIDRLDDIPIGANLVRVWDFSLPVSEEDPLWCGFARRNIAGYVPRFGSLSELEANPIYDSLDKTEVKEGNVKMFNFLACDDKTISEDDVVKGVEAICGFKGDIDNLGQIFQRGLIDLKNLEKRSSNFAKMAGLSRQVNAFFTVYVPYLCRKEFPSMYTIFAGGDDFFLVGPWHQTQSFALAINKAFNRYVAFNPEIHFSAGLVPVKSNVPIKTLADLTEEALEKSKTSGKNRVFLFDNVVDWSTFTELLEVELKLKELSVNYPLSSSYLYSLFELLEKARRTNDPEAMIWRSQLYYRTHRFVKDNRKLSEAECKAMESKLRETIFNSIEQYKGAFRIPLTNLFYLNRH